MTSRRYVKKLMSSGAVKGAGGHPVLFLLFLALCLVWIAIIAVNLSLHSWRWMKAIENPETLTWHQRTMVLVNQHRFASSAQNFSVHKVYRNHESASKKINDKLEPRMVKYRDNFTGSDWERIGQYQFKILKTKEDLMKERFYRKWKGNDVITTIPEADDSYTSNVCHGKPAPFLVCVVPSLPNQRHLRHVIRTTWASKVRRGRHGIDTMAHRQVALLFVFATDKYSRREKDVIRNESRVFSDVIAGRFCDSYYNLTRKVMFGMWWTLTSCPGVKFMAKVDPDTFLNLDLLLDMLDSLLTSGRSAFVLGYHHLTVSPPTVRHGRWAVKEEVYPPFHFPRYLYGHSYVISAQLLDPVLRMARRLPYFPPEDAFFTGVLSLLLNFTRLHSQRFAVSLRTVSACDLLSERFLSATSLTAGTVRKIGDVFRRGWCDPTDVVHLSNYRYADSI